jgi:cytochrome c-type biogenesis protein CcmH/NrfG
MKANPKYMPAWHYNGMANIMGGTPAEAVKSWQYVVDNDPAYAQKFQLDQRLQMAKRMAGQ